MTAFKSYPYAFFEGKIVPIEQAQISIMTNSLHYGVGVFGGIKVFKTDDGMAIFRLKDHLLRMRNSVNTLSFNYEFDVESTEEIIVGLAKKNKLKNTTYIRPLIYRSDTNLSPDIEGDYNLAVYMLDMPDYFDAETGIEVCVSDWQRNSHKTIPPHTKATGGYINSALAINDAHKAGFDSAIMLDKDGNVSEGAVMNIFLVKDGQLITPSLDSDILEGITRRTILDLAREMDIKVIERKVVKDELYDADEIFFTGTAANVTWCRSVDRTQISERPGEVSQKFVKAFANLSHTHPDYFTKVS